MVPAYARGRGRIPAVCDLAVSATSVGTVVAKGEWVSGKVPPIRGDLRQCGNCARRAREEKMHQKIGPQKLLLKRGSLDEVSNRKSNKTEYHVYTKQEY